MLTKLMAFLKCQIAILAALLETIAENTGNPHPEHTNIVKNTEACIKTDTGVATATQWIVWDQHSSTATGTVWFDSDGVLIEGEVTVLTDCECIDANDCCPEAEAAVKETTEAAAVKQ